MISVDWVVDATHPFALRISDQLNQACKGSGQELVRFERRMEASGKAVVLGSMTDLADHALSGRRLLLALGARQLVEAAKVARDAGATVFARVLPSPMSSDSGSGSRRSSRTLSGGATTPRPRARCTGSGAL